MQSFNRQLQRSTCDDQQAWTLKDKEETIQKVQKDQQRAKCSNWEEISETPKKQEKEENIEEASDYIWRK